MSMPDIRNFLEEFAPRENVSAFYHYGIVTAVNGGSATCDVKISGDTLATPNIHRLVMATAPIVGNLVLILSQGPDSIIIGVVA